MRVILTALGGLALVATAPMPAFAHHKPNHVIPTVEQARALRTTHRNPCNFASYNPHELIALRVMSDRCRRLRAQLAVRPDDAALRTACDRIATAYAGQPC